MVAQHLGGKIVFYRSLAGAARKAPPPVGLAGRKCSSGSVAHACHSSGGEGGKAT